MQVAIEAFTPVVGEGNPCEPSAIYVGATVNQGGIMINTFTRMGVPVGICSVRSSGRHVCHLGAGDFRDGESGQRGGWLVREPGL